MQEFVTKKSTFITASLLVVVGLVVSTVYFYNEYQKVKKTPGLIVKEEIKLVTNSIRRFMELPANEEPTLATITDINKLNGQEFFKNAINGDKILIYTKAAKAILYRPSTNKVIEFAPLVLTPQSDVTSQEKPATIAIYNGTKTVGLAGEYEKKLKDVSGLSVVVKDNATKNDYLETIVVVLDSTYKEVAAKVSQLVGGRVVEALPEGEVAPQAGLLIIVGNN